MKLIRTMLALIGVASVPAACGGSGRDAAKALGLTNPESHVVHAIPGGPSVDFIVNGSAPSGKTGVRYLGETNFTNIDLYFVSPGSDINAVSPSMAGVSFKNAMPPSGQDSIYVSGGTYVLIASRAGSKTPISSRLRSISRTTPTGWSRRCRSAAS